jgi:predicted ester cyclase
MEALRVTGQSKELVAEYMAAVTARDYDRAAELSDPDRVSIAPAAEPAGIDQLSAGFELFHESFDDFTATIIMQIAEGEQVFARLTWGGTHAREFLGVQPSGAYACIEVYRIDRCSNGKLIETRYMYDLPSFLGKPSQAR